MKGLVINIWISILFAFTDPEIDAHNVQECRLLEHFGKSRLCQKSRPVSRYSQAVEVYLSIELHSIHALDEKQQTLQTSVWLKTTWKDDNVTWNKFQFGSVDSFLLPANEIWIPDMCITNELNDDKCMKIGENDKVSVNSDGQIYLWKGLEIKTHCNLDITKYPFDKQKCPIRIRTHYSTDDKVRLKGKHRMILMQNYKENGAWEVLDNSVMEKRQNEVTNLTEVHFEITLKRRYLFHVYNYVLPVVLLSMLNIFTFLLPIESDETSRKSVHECTLYNNIEKELSCSTFVTPYLEAEKPLIVELLLRLISIHSIEEQNQVFRATVWLDIEWMDTDLKWDVSKYNGTKDLLVPANKVWIPDLCFVNEVTNEKCLKPNEDERVKLSHDGKVTMWISKEISTQCKIDINNYPFDYQKCTVNLGMWYSVDEKVTLKSKEPRVRLGNYQPNGEWDIMDTGIRMEKQNVDENFTEIHFIINLRRLSIFYIYTVILPVVLLSVLNIMCFLLPIETGEKVGLAMSIFLSLAVFMSIISGSVPKQSRHQFRLGIYVTIELMMSCLTIVMEVFVVRVYSRPSERPLGRMYRRLLPNSTLLDFLQSTHGQKDPARDGSRENFTDRPTACHRCNGGVPPVYGEVSRNYNPWHIVAMRLDKIFGVFVAIVNALSMIAYFAGIYA
ncbi:hypothetical protein FSP39_011217 [Pinctada imbricata]|uniref:Uncharacterized protein n=1 Tax=Pinctada imbricata TaxID=66713 RepID=A0AA89C358_PINIB|nr:hypothetical protein FSP39_011217 [Pinctada imbricata]